MSNRIIVPAHYDFEIIIRLDTNRGQSDLQVRNRSKKTFTMWQVVGLLIEHSGFIMKSLLTTGGKDLNLTKTSEQIKPDQTTLEPEQATTSTGDEHAS